MTQNLEHVYEQLASLKTDLADLRNSYKGVSKSYQVAIGTMSDLTIHSAEAAKRAALSTEQSRIAALNAMTAAKEASTHPSFIAITEAAVTAAAAAAAASAAVAHQAEESLLKASTEASSASKIAAEAAAAAVRLSLEAKGVISGGGDE